MLDKICIIVKTGYLRTSIHVVLVKKKQLIYDTRALEVDHSCKSDFVYFRRLIDMFFFSFRSCFMLVLMGLFRNAIV